MDQVDNWKQEKTVVWLIGVYPADVVLSWNSLQESSHENLRFLMMYCMSIHLNRGIGLFAFAVFVLFGQLARPL